MIIQKLRHNILLCKKNFGRFVECWNNVVDRVANLKGDQDLNPSDGYITIDYTIDSHPVARLDYQKLHENLSGGSGTYKYPYREPWDINLASLSIYNTWYQIGTYRGQAVTSDFDLSGLLSACQESHETSSVWCKMDLVNLSAEAVSTEIQTPTYYSVRILDFTQTSSEISIILSSFDVSVELPSGEITVIMSNDISVTTQWQTDVDYCTRYPLMPAWENYAL